MIEFLKKYLTPNQEKEMLEDQNCDRRMELIKNWKNAAHERDKWTQLLKKASAQQVLWSQ